ncbi:ATP-dependent Clp protease ATP-binding subunit [Patescibacteria group bacterium]|nr:ATP-dependent Clp protease ATP-binding subunit [Patescibacteria group bacterium]
MDNINDNQHKFNKFTKEAKQALVIAQDRAKKVGLDYVGTEHLLMGILSQENSLGAHILYNFGVTEENVQLVLETVGRISTSSPKPKPKNGNGKTGLSGFAKKVIEEALRSGEKYTHAYVGTEHLLFALVSQEDTAATVILENMQVNPADVRDQIIQTFERGKEIQNAKQSSNQKVVNPMEFFLNGLQGAMTGSVEKDQFGAKNQFKTGKKTDGKPSKTPALDYFTDDLVLKAAEGNLDAVIGREKEIDRLVSILCRRTKNNPVLIGEPGVGKTAVAEGLAQAIADGKVPEMLTDKKLLSLSMTAVIAGTKYRGEFEERVKQILDELKSVKNAILFIDEIHTVVGAGSAEGSLDAANILKPALSRGDVQVVGATTTTEYRKHIESDAALERRFQQIVVEEPTMEQTKAMIQGLKASFEDHHNMQITDDAIDAAVTMSKRYINDRFLPDKAIDLIDEASSLKRVNTKVPTNTSKNLQKELQKIIKEKENSVSAQNYEHAAELRNKELEIIKAIAEAKKTQTPRGKRKKVTADDISDFVSAMTGIPVTKLVKSDMQRLIDIEKRIKKAIIGQDEGVETVCKAIKRSRAGFADHNRPIGSFIFMGPTGVGKTELVRALAKEVFNDKDALIKIDMSEFMERHSTSRLVGTTAGYVGYDDGGQLTEAVRRKPYSIVLFDEIEKAHSDVFNLLLQILEDGILTDSKGRKVDFKNTIIILTSNIGADKLTEKAGPIGFDIETDKLKIAESEYQATKEEILKELKKNFKPEFLNRIDKTIVFRPLTHENIKEIVKLHIGILQERLSSKNLKIEVTPKGLDYLANVSYDKEYGARPVRRKIQDLIEDPLTQNFLEEIFVAGDTIEIDVKDDKIVLKKK